ncbi:MAG TPA: hypothetical protein VF591_22055 [Pyrinomonadaceae bacterium]|jgi:hypothetical protein
MLKIIGSITLTALALVVPATLILTSPVSRAARRGFAAAFGLWLAAAAGLAALGFFSSGRGGTPAIGAAVLVPVLLASLLAAWSPVVRAFASGVPLVPLVASNVGRLLGAFFLFLYGDGFLPPTFALTAGWGDVFVGTTAALVAWAAYRRAGGWRALTLVWNAVGFLDLLAAVALGVGSAQNSPVRFIHETPNTAVMSTLPWFLIPGFLVPLYLLTHLMVFARLSLSGKSRPASRGRAVSTP